MNDPAPTWAVVATVDEPPGLVQAFVAWHLAAGAREVRLFFDRPDDPAALLFAQMSSVFVTVCDEDYWRQNKKGRPNRHQNRQVHNARIAYQATQADWLAHIDADEFIWSTQPIGAVLAACAPACDCVVLPVAERFFPMAPPAGAGSAFDGAFRLPFRRGPKAGQRLFGDDFLLTRCGLTGHAAGKAFARADRGLNMSIHRPRRRVKHQAAPLVLAQPAALTLLHFDGLTPQYWVFKLLRMLRALTEADGMPPALHRAMLAEALLQDPAGTMGLHDRLKVLDEQALAVLRKRDLLLRPNFALEAAVDAIWGKDQVDLSVAGFDAWLAAHKAESFAFAGVSLPSPGMAGG